MGCFRRYSVAFAIILGMMAAPSVTFGQENSAPDPEQWLNNFEQIRAEQLIDDGRRALNDGDFATAADLLSQAIQVTKANNGLHSKLQIPALTLLVEAHLGQRDWRAADQQMGYLEWLNSMVYQENFYDYLRGSEELSRLLLSASADIYNPVGARYLVAAKNLNWRTVSAIEATLGEDSIELAPWLYNIVLTHYYQSALTKRRGMTSYDYRSDKSALISGWSLRKNEYMRISHSIGKELLERIQTLHANAENRAPESKGLISVYLGDWEMLFGRNNVAMDHYREAHRQLAEAEISADRINQFFSRPQILPVNRLVTRFDDEEENADLRYVAWSPNYLAAAVPQSQLANASFSEPSYRANVRFNLVPLGSSDSNRLILVMNGLQILEANPDNQQVREFAEEEISMLQFRPGFRDGELISHRNVEMEYLFSTQVGPAFLTDNN